MKLFSTLTITFLLLIQTVRAQDTEIKNQTSLQSPANFNISGQGKAFSFTTTQGTVAAGNGHYLMHQSDGNARWAIGMNTPESGTGNAGSNFSIYAYGSSYLGEYLTLQRSNGYMGLGIRSPQANLHIVARAIENSGLRFGVPDDGGNINVPINASTGGYNIDFHTWRDVVGNQIGARMRAERVNNYYANNARIQAMDFVFYTSSGILQSDLTEKMRIRHNGNVGIGTDNPDAKLAVKGVIKATKLKVTQTDWADFVFEQSYELPSLQRVEDFIKQHKHLPDIPSAREVKESGLDLGEMDSKLLRKIEELTLYIIQQDKEMWEMKERLKLLENKTIKK